MSAQEPPDATGSAIEQAVRRSVLAMHRDPARYASVEDVARSVSFSRCYFTRTFRRATGSSPRIYLRSVRIEEAKRLLRSSSLSVTEITLQVGYTGVGTFSTVFRETVGVSPTRYRAGHRAAALLPATAA